MGIDIRYLAPAAAGTTLTYSVERFADSTFYDFDRGCFRPRGHIQARADVRQLTYDGEFVTATFHDVDPDEAYIFYIRDGQSGNIIAEVPVPGIGNEDFDLPRKGRHSMGPSYRAGKKFIDGKAISAKHRFTFHGDDGFTVHTATLWEDGTSSCNCPRWGRSVNRFGERSCQHSERALTLTSNVDETAEQPEPPAPQKGTNPFRRHSRPIDT